MRKRLVALVAALLAATGLTLVASAPAQAAYTDCSVGYVCLFDGYNGTGAMHPIPVSPRGYCYNVPTSFNDRANSAYNRMTTRWVQFYTNAGCTGHLLHSAVDCSGGPFEPHFALNFYVDGGDPWCHFSPVNDSNRLTSVFFNTN